MLNTLVRLIVLAVVVTCASAHAEDWLTAAQFGDLHVVATDAEPGKSAADAFVENWKRVTGHEPTRNAAPRTGAALNVWIGAENLPAPLKEGLALDRLGPDGVRMRTATLEDGKHLVLAGEGERGTGYAVHDFVERYLGVRWLAPDVTHVPAAPASLPEIDYAYTPPFEHRTTSYLDYRGDDAFTRAHKISGKPSFGLFVHTAYTIVSPDKYKDHPEYFALVDGKRRVPAGLKITWPDLGPVFDEIGQLCWTNPELHDVIFNEIAERIRKTPEHRIWSVSQMDWGNNCECDACKAVDEREGTPAGSLLVAVNAVAERLEKEFPGYYIETLAYTYTRKAPKHIKPRDNVIIRLCSIECDFARPLADPGADRNVLFAQDIRDWAKIAKTLYIWDYTPNFRLFQAPHPNFHVLQPNMQFFAGNHVKGMFEQGCAPVGGELGRLRSYMIAKLLWNPGLDGHAIRDEFIDLYYAEGAPFIKEYIDLITKRVLDSELSMSCFDELQWMDAETVERARELFGKAFAAARTDEVRTRLVEASIPVELAALLCPPRVEVSKDSFTLRRPPCMDLEQYIHLCKSFGIVEPYEVKGFDDFRTIVMGGATPPRVQSSPLVKIANERYELWVLPELKGAAVRFRDKANGLELLRSYENYGHGPGTWEDWTVTPGVLEHAAAHSYKVVEQTPNSVVLEGTTPEGLLVRRRMEVKAGSDRVDVTLTMKNTTDKPNFHPVKLHPEFAAQEGGMPQIWTGGASGWTWANRDHDPRLAAFGEYIDRGDRTKMAYYMPDKNLTLLCEFEPENVSSILYYFNTDKAARQVNLEVLPPRTPLAPGAELSLKAAYSVAAKPPQDL